MKDRIAAKVSDAVDYILTKPVETITHEDYLILRDEINKIQSFENSKGGIDWIAMLMAIMAMNSPFK